MTFSTTLCTTKYCLFFSTKAIFQFAIMSKKQQQHNSDGARKDSASSIKILVTQPSGVTLESDSESEEEILKDRFLNPPPLKKVSDPGLFDYSLVRNPVGFPVVMDYPNRTRTPSGNKVKFSVENINEEDLQEVCIIL